MLGIRGTEKGSNLEMSEASGIAFSIILFADAWDDMWRRRQQLADKLAKLEAVDKVIYVERPLTLASLVRFLLGSKKDPESATRWKRIFTQKSLVCKVSSNIYLVTPLALLSFARARVLAPIDWFFHHHVQAFIIRRVVEKLKLENIVLWAGLPLIPQGLLTAFNSKLLWYDCIEDLSSFPNFSDHTRSTIRNFDEHVSQTADIVSAVNRELYEKKKVMNRNVYWIPNAVDVDLFLNYCDDKPPQDLEDIKRPRLVFVGLADMRNDWDLLEYVVTERSDWSIVLIGSVALPKEVEEKFAGYPSVYFMGKRPYQQLPSYLYHSDACIQIYRQDDLNYTGNSQKQFLYLASGKPIVSTYTADIDNLAHIVRIAQAKDEFVAQVEYAIATDSAELEQSRIEYAQANSWDVRAEQIVTIVTEKLRAS